MINERTIHSILVKIKISKEFINSELHKNLLSYLVAASLKGETPKELVIAREVFDKGVDFNPDDDSYVRSNIYKLRKKLESYYEHEGLEDQVILSIPKGAYHVEFNKCPSRKKKKFSSKKIIFMLLIPTVIFMLLNIYQYKLIKSLTISSLNEVERHPFWSDFLESDLQTILVIDDYYSFSEENYFFNISTDSSHSNKIESRSKDITNNLSMKHQHDFISWNAINSSFRIGQIFHRVKRKVSILRSSKCEWHDLANNNVIYIGSTLGLNILSNILRITHFKYKNPNEIFITDENSEVQNKYPMALISDEDEYREGHAIIAKCPGPNNNSILLLISNLDMTQSFTIERVCEILFLNQLDSIFNNNYQKKPKYFEILIKVRGLIYVGFDYDIIYYNEVNTNYSNYEKYE